MARRVKNARAAKEARQKKIAIGGAILLLAVLAFQVPRTMKMLKGAEPTAAAPAAPAPSAPGGAGTAAASLLETSSSGVSGRLVSFGNFESKDPFKPQVDRATLGGGANPAQAGADPGSPAGATSTARRRPSPAPAASRRSLCIRRRC